MKRAYYHLLLSVAALFLLPSTVACGPDAVRSVDPTPSPSLTAAAVAQSEAIFTNSSGETVGLRLEIADTPEKKQTGLMFRESLPEDQGMLFIMDDQSQAAFWMKDTRIPLSIAFIAADGRILSIQDMQPLSLDTHSSPAPYRYAIEVNSGWFNRNGIRDGDRVQIPPLAS